MRLPRGIPVGEHEWLTNCYSCGKQKLYYNLAKEKGWCHRCHAIVYSKQDLRRKYDASVFILVSRQRGYARTGVGTLPQEAVSAVFIEGVREYLHSRHLNDLEILEQRFMHHNGVLYCPVQPLSSELPEAWLRRVPNQTPWMPFKGLRRGCYVFTEDVEWKEAERICVVEGIFDAMPNRFDIPTIALLGCNVSKELVAAIEQSSVKEIVSCLDPDFAGEKGTERVKEMAETLSLKHTQIKLKADPGSYGRVLGE